MALRRKTLYTSTAIVAFLTLFFATTQYKLSTNIDTSANHGTSDFPLTKVIHTSSQADAAQLEHIRLANPFLQQLPDVWKLSWILDHAASTQADSASAVKDAGLVEVQTSILVLPRDQSSAVAFASISTIVRLGTSASDGSVSTGNSVALPVAVSYSIDTNHQIFQLRPVAFLLLIGTQQAVILPIPDVGSINKRDQSGTGSDLAKRNEAKDNNTSAHVDINITARHPTSLDPSLTLEQILHLRADPKKRITLLSVSAGFVPFALNWACNLRTIPDPPLNYLFLAEDIASYDALKTADEPVYLDPVYSLPSGDNLEAANYGELRYQEMIHNRVQLVLKVMKLGYNTLVADIDAVWKGNPYKHFLDGYDLQAQMDEDGEYNVCGGFLFFQSTTESLKLWESVAKNHEEIVRKMKEYAKKHQKWDLDKMTEQKELSNQLYERRNDKRFKWRKLDKSLFPSGRSYFTDNQEKYKEWQSQRKYPIVVHNNYIIGFDAKKARFVDAGLWELTSESTCPHTFISTILSLPSSAQDPEGADLEKLKGLSTPQKPFTQLLKQATKSTFSLRLKVLTYDRHLGLKRLLESLAAAEYDGDIVFLDIYVDKVSPNSRHNEVMDVIDQFTWPHGPKYVLERSIQVGVQPQWIESWHPSHPHEYAFIMEDDIEVSPFYYRWLKEASLKYHQGATQQKRKLYGVSLQRQYLIPARPGEHLNIDNGHKPFAYKLLGTWGFLLFPDSWKDFRNWYAEFRNSGFKPEIPGLVTTKWYKELGEKIWTPWFIYWANKVDQYCVYTNFPDNACLSTSYRDKGNTYSSSAGADCKLIRQGSVLNLHQFPDQLEFFDYSANVV